MYLDQVLRKCVATLLGLSTGFLACVILCSSKRFQRHIFYLHKAPIWWGQQLDKPESFGFLHKQVLPLRIPTTDSQSLYAWLVSPLTLYAKHEKTFLAKNPEDDDYISIKLLRSPESCLVIYFHGNAGSVGQARRTDAYRMVSGLSPPTHVLTFDYRGFARSSGSPSEAGLIDDALSVIKWATTAGGVPTSRIVLLAQSLGTAVASAAVDALLSKDQSIQFAGIILCATFPDAPSAVMSYRILGHFQLLAPLKILKPLREWFISRFHDKWDTRHRLGRIVRSSDFIRLTLIAAENDEVVECKNTEQLFSHVVEKSIGDCSPGEGIDSRCVKIDLCDGGIVREWRNDKRHIKMVRVCFGGHNRIMKWSPVSLEVLKCFET